MKTDGRNKILKTKNLPSSAKYCILKVKNETCKQVLNDNRNLSF
jgi:hypothetical protein